MLSSRVGKLASHTQKIPPGLRRHQAFYQAQRLEKMGGAEVRQQALKIYQALATQGGALAKVARLRAEALRGRGSLGRRLEIFSRDFLRELTSPAMLLGLTAASTVYKVAYAGFLSRLAPAGRAFSLGRLWGNRALSSGAALSLEVPTWVAAENGMHHLMGQKVDWHPSSFLDQSRSAFLTLGLWRGAQGVGGQVAALLGAGGRARNTLASLSGGFGIYHALKIQEGLAGGPERVWADRLFATGTFWLQAHGAGRLSQTLMGKPMTSLHRQLELSSRQAEARAFQSLRFDPGIFFPRFVAQSLWAGPLRSPGEPAKVKNLVFSKGSKTSQSPLEPSVLEKRLEQMTRPVFTPESFKPQEVPAEKKPKRVQRIGLALSGGNSSAENAVVERMVLGAKERGGDIQVVGILKGLEGLVNPVGEFPKGRIWPLSVQDVYGVEAIRHAHRQLLGIESYAQGLKGAGIDRLGGDLLRSSRFNPLEKDPQALRVKESMKRYGLDALVLVGGNGSQRAARELAAQKVPLVFLPQSIDADVPGSVISIGFPSAVNRGPRGLYEMMNTGHCGNRFLVEVMGQKYGLLALAIGLNARKGHYVLDGEAGPPLRVESVFTEIPRSFKELTQLIQRGKDRGHHHGVILFSEGLKFKEFTPARKEDAKGRMLIDNGDVVKQVRQELAEQNILDVRTFALGYALRGTKPSEHDIQLAKQMSDGALALLERGSFGRAVDLDFIHQSALMTMRYPKLGDWVYQAKTLDPAYEKFVRNYLERDPQE